MATGTIANGTLTQNLEIAVYTVDDTNANGYAVVSVMLMNAGTSDANIRIAVHEGSVQSADYIEYDFTIVPKGMIERTGVVVGAGQSISCWATNSSDVTFRINGTEVGVADPIV